jgi:quercetin dioxygenase-like cupin family protein
MEVLAVPTRQLAEYGSTGAGLSRAALVQVPQDGFAVDVIRLAPGGTLGRHPTRLWQLFLVVSGSGWVSGADDERRPLGVGEAVLWAPGEEHASGSDGGLTAVVVQCRVRPLAEEGIP